jgi:hypothetical protein
MIAWLKRLFLGKPRVKRLPKRKIYLIENYKHNESTILKRQRIEDIPFGGGGIGMHRVFHPAGVVNLRQYRYWCPCGTELSDGPSGGAAVNAVCDKCRINYGDLPGYWGH